MTLDGSYTFNAPRERVWALLMDPAVIASSIPGCEGLEPIGDDCFKARIVAVVAAISGSYDGKVCMKDKVAPESYRLVVDGQGRHGFVNGESRITLKADAATTVVSVAATLEVGGTIARVGQRLLGTVGKMMMDRFFAGLQAKV
jgi:carbon monoxide dehydrogenase subunit G